jgi:hypothetical protein
MEELYAMDLPLGSTLRERERERERERDRLVSATNENFFLSIH